jgi:hypothetical protein
MLRVIAAASLLILSACISEPTLQDFAATCEGYGFQPETEGIAGCVQRERLAYANAMQQSMA